MPSGTIASGINVRWTPRQNKSVKLLQLPFQLFPRLLQRNLLGLRSCFADRPEVTGQLLAIFLALLRRGAPRNAHARPGCSVTRCRSGRHRTPNRSIRVGQAATQAPRTCRRKLSREGRPQEPAPHPGKNLADEKSWKARLNGRRVAPARKTT